MLVAALTPWWRRMQTWQSCLGIFQSPVYWESLGLLVRGIPPENIPVVIATSVPCAFLLGSLPLFISYVTCPLLSCMKQLKALSAVAMTALLFVLSSFMPRTDDARAGIPVCWLLLDLLLRPCLLSCLLFLFALVSLFLECLAECTGSHFYISFCGSGRGSSPLIQLSAFSRYALFQLLAFSLLSYLAFLYHALVYHRTEAKKSKNLLASLTPLVSPTSFHTASPFIVQSVHH